MEPRTQDGRGRYDRGAGATQRLVDQRSRLLRTCTLLLATQQTLTVESLTRTARLGRNTFYVHFSDVDDIVDAIVHGATRQLGLSVTEAIAVEVTPLSRLTALCRVWLAWGAADASTLAALAGLPRQRLAPVRAIIEDALRVCVERAHQDGLVSRPASGWLVAIGIGAILEAGWSGTKEPQDIAAASDDLARIVVSAFR